TAPTTNYTDSSVGTGTRYCCVIRAVDRAGNISTNSNEYCVTTDASESGYPLTASPTQAIPGQTITLTFHSPAASNSARDWVGLYRVGSTDRQFVAWKYTNGVAQGSLNFVAP